MKIFAHFLNLHFVSGWFPLTPALSLGEREKRSQLLGKATAAFSIAVHKFYEDAQRLFPLPGGEGQGEGKDGLLVIGDNHLQGAFAS